MPPMTTHYELKVEENDIKKESGTIKSESLSDRDAGFCSGEETDLDAEYPSPTTETDHNHDSMDTKDFIAANAFRPMRLKRPGIELRGEDVPENKAIKLENCSDREASPCSVRSGGSVTPYIKPEKACSPFRPWSAERSSSCEYSSIPSSYLPPYVSDADFVQDEPLALVVDKKMPREESPPLYRLGSRSPYVSPHSVTANVRTRDLSVSSRPQEVVRFLQSSSSPSPHIDEHCTLSPSMKSPSLSQDEASRMRCDSAFSVIVSREGKSSQCGAASSSSSRGGGSNSQQRNYKNMTRERRIEANARERSRVHTISAAFETLRNCIPAYANNQKLSKLSVLRIACSYIMTLSRIAGHDYSIDESAPTLADCIDNVCSTIQMEGKTRKKKDDD